jgi:hypothetical protein
LKQKVSQAINYFFLFNSDDADLDTNTIRSMLAVGDFDKLMKNICSVKLDVEGASHILNK